MSDQKKPFTVTDRRLFNSEGRIREEAAEAQPAGDPAASAPEAEGPAPEAEAPAASDSTAAPMRFPTDLPGLLVSLATQATLLLTAIGEGEGEPQGPDLEGARSVITLIEVLQDKTQGRRTAEEDQLFEALLYELRMAYVAATRAAGK